MKITFALALAAALVSGPVMAQTAASTAAAKPSLTKRLFSKPAMTKPALAKPIATKPVVTKPAVAKPAAANNNGQGQRTAKSLACSKQADSQNIHGQARKSFMSKCKKA